MAVRVWNQTIDAAEEMAGTLTCVARSSQAPHKWIAVTAAHVVAPLVSDGTPGPSSGDQIAFRFGNTSLTGTLWFWCDLQKVVDGFVNEFDAALIEIQPADAQALIAATRQPTTFALLNGQTEIAFDGVISGVSSGQFANRHSSEALIYSVLGGSLASVAFKDSLDATLPAKKGDSGALITSNGQAIGQLIASDGEESVFLPLAPLLKAFQLDWAGTAPAAGVVPTPVPAAVVGDRAQAVDTLARTLWGEARGEPLRGIRAVAAVVLNRALHQRVKWWGRTIVGVCRAPSQFSCWNGNDPNLPQLMAVTTTDSRFRICMDVADEALAGQLGAQRQLGATHYHTKTVHPKWALGRVPCDDIGNHLFYNDIE